MPINLGNMGLTPERWVELQGHLSGVDVLVRFCSPRESQKFKRRMVTLGIMKYGKSGEFDLNAGREEDFFKAYAEFYILDWRGDVHEGGEDGPAPAYSAKAMGSVLAASNEAFDLVDKAILEEAAFFAKRSSGSS